MSHPGMDAGRWPSTRRVARLSHNATFALELITTRQLEAP